MKMSNDEKRKEINNCIDLLKLACKYNTELKHSVGLPGDAKDFIDMKPRELHALCKQVNLNVKRKQDSEYYIKALLRSIGVDVGGMEVEDGKGNGSDICKDIPHEVRYEICRMNCEQYGKCENPFGNGCRKLYNMVKKCNEELGGRIDLYSTPKSDNNELHMCCVNSGIKVEPGMKRGYYLQALMHGCKSITKAVFDGKPGNEGIKVKKKLAMFAQEVAAIYGPSVAYDYCRVQEWKNRERALSGKPGGKFERKADMYAQLASGYENKW